MSPAMHLSMLIADAFIRQPRVNALGDVVQTRSHARQLLAFAILCFSKLVLLRAVAAVVIVGSVLRALFRKANAVLMDWAVVAVPVGRSPAVTPHRNYHPKDFFALLRSALIGSFLALTYSLSALAASFEELPDGRVVLTVLGEKLAFREQDL